ncbi:MAG TPA: hypothetical protein PLZ45_13410 [Ferruginibacter sp.]|nr:hypothetical protein [Ferruginibacter sp.]
MSASYQHTPHYTKDESADRHFQQLRQQVNRISAEEIVDLFVYGNAVRFLRDFF